ncbi:MAG: hypothetical protein JRN66_08125 [Nitrososphaerota archaeon]|jgi:hypothetical protein|nr:hypothetical protein [Nitrososphaerota archaeon]
MSNTRPPSQGNLGDWLIWRSTGLFGDFRMPVCSSIIASEGLRNGWIDQMTEGDITRILARYKEHVSFWNIGLDVIKSELAGFAQAIGRDYYSIASKFDKVRAKAIPRGYTDQYFELTGDFRG